MPDTLIQKILRGRSPGPVNVGDIAICDVDLAVLIDIQFRHGRLEDIVAVHDPDKVAIVLDHAVPAPSISDAEYTAISTNGSTARTSSCTSRGTTATRPGTPWSSAAPGSSP